MSGIKCCRIITHKDKHLERLVQDLAFDCGYFFASNPNKKRVYHSDITNGAMAMGDYWNDPPQKKELYQWNLASLTREHWPLFDARTEMEKLRTYMGLQPEWDETPLPYDMPKETAEQTKLRFNLSDEQWNMLPINAKEALAGAKVAVKMVKSRWIKIDEDHRPPPGESVVFTNNTRNATKNVSYLAVGYDDEVMYGEIIPTHYALLPSSRVKQEDEEWV